MKRQTKKQLLKEVVQTELDRIAALPEIVELDRLRKQIDDLGDRVAVITDTDVWKHYRLLSSVRYNLSNTDTTLKQAETEIEKIKRNHPCKEQ